MQRVWGHTRWRIEVHKEIQHVIICNKLIILAKPNKKNVNTNFIINMKKIYLLLLSFCFISIAKATTDTPDLYCVSVQPNGNIRLTWVPVTQTVGFNYYLVYEGFGSIVGTLNNITDSTYLDTQSNGNISAHIYQIVAVYNAFTWNYSNQMFSMHLTTTNSSPNSNPGVATINWTTIASQAGAGFYTVYSNYNASGTLALFHPGVFYTTLTDTQQITNCNIPIQYQVRVNYAPSCVSQSNIVTDTFTMRGNLVSNPDLRCVSVAPNGSVQLTWLPPSGSSTDFNAYTIWRDGTLIDSAANFSLTSYTDVNVNANNQSYSYHIQSQSGCAGNLTTNTGITTLSSMFLVNSSPATNTCQLNWTPLPLMPSSPFYRVNRNIAGNNIIISNTITQQYIDINPPGPSTPTYQITAPDNSGCISNSNVSNGCTISGINNLNPNGCTVRHTINNSNNSFDFESLCINDQQIIFELYNSIGQQTNTVIVSKNASGSYALQKTKLHKGLNLFVIRTKEHLYSGKIMAL